MGWFARPALDPKQQAEKEAKAVQELRALLLQSPEVATQLVQGGELPSAEACTSDAYLRKWLVAREWDVAVTHKCIVQHAGWRAHMMPHGYIDEAWIQEPLGRESVFLQGTDSLGRAFAIVRVRDHVAVDKAGLKAMKLFTCYVMNAMAALCDPERNPRGRLVSMFDMSGSSYANLDVKVMTMVLGLLGQHYVERLDLLCFYNPSAAFWRIWHTFKGLLPEVTRSKIRVISRESSELTDVVPQAVLPREFGGTAELLHIRDAVRKFRLPPYPHVPELLQLASGPAAASAAATAPSTSASCADSDDDGDVFVDALEDFADAEQAAAAAAAAKAQHQQPRAQQPLAQEGRVCASR